MTLASNNKEPENFMAGSVTLSVFRFLAAVSGAGKVAQHTKEKLNHLGATAVTSYGVM
jgi:glutamate dehydrogenase/leucine dehydrogenase